MSSRLPARVQAVIDTLELTGADRLADAVAEATEDGLFAEPDTTPVLEIPAAAFEAIADTPGGKGRADDHLLASVQISGIAFHVDAYAVHTVRGMQAAFRDDEDLADIHRVSGADGPFQTVRIRRRRYVLVLTPYS